MEYLRHFGGFQPRSKASMMPSSLFTFFACVTSPEARDQHAVFNQSAAWKFSRNWVNYDASLETCDVHVIFDQ